MTKANKTKAVRRVLMGLLFAVGSIVIILASMVLMNIFLADDIDTRELTDSLEDFKSVYDEYPSMRDLPEGLEVLSSTCRIRGNIFSYDLKIKNTGIAMTEYSLQVFYNEDFMELKPKANNPFLREYSDEGLLILSGETKELTITGTLSQDIDPEEFKAAMEYVYLEVIYGGIPGRVMLPVNIQEG